MKCPYSEIELLVAMVGIDKKLEEYVKANGEGAFEKKVEEIANYIDMNVSNKKAMAEHFGITQQDLINSPNYKDLLEEYRETLVLKVLNVLKSSFGWSDKEAWAFFVQALKA